MQLNKNSKALIIDLVNKKNFTSFTEADVDIVNIRPGMMASTHNTDAEVVGIGEFELRGSGEIHYNRLDAGVLFDKYDTTVIYDPSYLTSLDLVNVLNARFQLGLSGDDIQSEPLGTVTLPMTVTVACQPSCPAYFGSFQVELVDDAPVDPEPEPEDDLSMIIAPVTLEDVELPAAFSNGEFMFAGNGNPVGGFIQVSNGEIALAGAARIAGDPDAISPVSGAYTIQLNDDNDWSLPLNIALVDTANGTVLTDLYDVVYNIDADETSGSLDLTLRQNGTGDYELYNATNELVTVGGYTDEGGTFYQDVQLASVFSAALGGLTANTAGGVLGDFIIQITATRRTGDVAPVVLTYSVSVQIAA